MEYTQEEFKKRLDALNPGLKDAVLSLEVLPCISDIRSHYKLDNDIFFDFTHNLTLYILKFISKEDFLKYLGENLHQEQKVVREELQNIEHAIEQETGGVSEEDEGTKPTQPDNLNHVDILSEIENPTPSIQYTEPVDAIPDINTVKQDEPTPSTDTTPKNAMQENTTAHKTTLSEAIGNIPTIGGFKPIESPAHPAAPLAEKLDQKLSTSTASTPKEVYHVKPLDPYHEPVE